MDETSPFRKLCFLWLGTSLIVSIFGQFLGIYRRDRNNHLGNVGLHCEHNDISDWTSQIGIKDKAHTQRDGSLLQLPAGFRGFTISSLHLWLGHFTGERANVP
ncbi:hypothetical protein J4Q44_G00141560 [Coregonus suidteri]|uniref:Uncharacterized protein n=1 Tax=Coregonus suidteri TaxID=861788 RepID=A0AAN8LQB3_9TELE